MAGVDSPPEPSGNGRGSVRLFAGGAVNNTPELSGGVGRGRRRLYQVVPRLRKHYELPRHYSAWPVRGHLVHRVRHMGWSYNNPGRAER
jgi:hypothetical protein